MVYNLTLYITFFLAGRSVQKVRNLLNCHLVKSEWYLTWLISLPSFHSFKIIDEKLVCVYMRQVTCKMNKPYAVGATILEHSKRHMIREWHEFIMKKFENVRLLFSGAFLKIMKSLQSLILTVFEFCRFRHG